ncbi:MAG: hypothetical protein IMF17_00475 [Proteobacteria bacterium]|nr:hypothetical protein [Pseudomonadota bacterium]
MLYRNLIIRVTGGLMFSLLLAFASTAFAEDRVVDGPLISDYSFQLIENGSNPWALPEVPEQSKYQLFRGQRNQSKEHQGTRFVTPEILESLKQQQMMYQQPSANGRNRVPSKNNSNQGRFNRTMPAQPAYGLSAPGSSYTPPMYSMPSPGGYGMPLDGMSYSNPMVDVPSVSPWGNTSDLLQRGGTFPWMPNAAVGGLPPIHVQPFAEDQDADANWGDYDGRELNDDVKQFPGNVFNPFSFGPNGNL